MYRIKVKIRTLRTRIVIQRKILFFWIYINGYNVNTKSILSGMNEILNLVDDIKNTYKIPKALNEKTQPLD